MSLLKEGHILAISPGGVREALFSDHNYEIIWGKRCGFAKVAYDAKVVGGKLFRSAQASIYRKCVLYL